MDDQALIAQWQAEERQPFEGWNFSYLKDRWHEAQPAWSYDALVRTLLCDADSFLDMGTGGGEKLLSFADALPSNTIATEGYPPNLIRARENLKPHGIEVVPYDCGMDDHLPFADDSFALVINRHEAYDAVEVARVLRPGGKHIFTVPIYPRPETVVRVMARLEQAGLVRRLTARLLEIRDAEGMAHLLDERRRSG